MFRKWLWTKPFRIKCAKMCLKHIFSIDVFNKEKQYWINMVVCKIIAVKIDALETSEICKMKGSKNLENN